MLCRINNVKIALAEAQDLKAAAAKKLGLDASYIGAVRLLRRAVDARKKTAIIFNYQLAAELAVPQRFLPRLLRQADVSRYEETPLAEPKFGREKLAGPIIVIGAGPAGLAAALELARYGYKPLLVERGKEIRERQALVERFWRTGELDPESNVQFGAGGAGTFSDGKLTTRLKHPALRHILQTFVAAGAPEAILYEQQPHVGSDQLATLVRGLVKEIGARGGLVRYRAFVTDLLIKKNAVVGVQLADGTQLEAGAVVLAAGHSARETYRLLARRGVALIAKAFAAGLRIVHPQELIDRAQYGSFAGHPLLGPATYQLTYHCAATGRSAYSFCMCPGGTVLAAASEPGGVVVNGMSNSRRDSGVANSAIVVNVDSRDFGTDALAGVAWQRHYEALAFQTAGANFNAPAQNWQSFRDGTAASLASAAAAGYRPGLTAVELRQVLPDFISTTLVCAIDEWGQRLAGFADAGALLVGVETRTSAPLRILRHDSTYESLSHERLYPCGEGAGYAGGIMSAALDGFQVARALMARYAAPA